MTSTPDRSGWTSTTSRDAGTAPSRERRAARLPMQRGPAAWSAILPGQPAPMALDGDVTADVALVGGGFADRANIGRELWRGVRAEEAPARVEGLLRAYLAHREGPSETFHAFANRHEPDALRALAEAGEGGASA